MKLLLGVCMRIQPIYLNQYNYNTRSLINSKNIVSVPQRLSFSAKVPKVERNIKIEDVEKYTKDLVFKIRDFFERDPKTLSSDITPMVSSQNKIVGLKLDTADGTLKVQKQVKPLFADSLPYFLIKEIKNDGKISILGVDLKEYKFIKMKEDGKPRIKDDILYEYTPEQVIKKKYIERLESFINLIYEKADGKSPQNNIIELANKKPVREIRLEEIEDKNITKLVEKEETGSSNEAMSTEVEK